MICSLLWVLAAHAAPKATSSPPSELHGELLARFRELTDTADGDGPRCLTPLVPELEDNWELFSTAERAEITARLAPWATDLRTAVHARAAAPPPPPYQSETPCLATASGTDSLPDPKGRFSITWDPGAISDATAADLLETLTTSYETEVEGLDWREPDGMSSYPMLVYVYEAPREMSAVTALGNCPGVGWVPYITFTSGSFNGSTWWRSTAAHEFNHASQYAYTNVTDSFTANIDHWWFEATADYMMEVVFPDDNWWSYDLGGYTDATHLAMETSGDSGDEFWHMYGMAIWAFYLDEHVGGPDLVQATWEFAARSNPATPLRVDEVIEGVGLDWDDVYTGFIANNTVMDFEEASWFGSVTPSNEVTTLPDSGSAGRRAPEGRGQHYIRIDKDSAASGAHAAVRFDGEDDVDWYALVVQSREGEVVRTRRIELDSSAAGSAEIVFDAASDFWLVVSPNTADADGKSYDWAIESFEPDTGGGTADSGASPDSHDGKEGGGCGCTAGPTPPGLALAGLVAVVALARRRLA